MGDTAESLQTLDECRRRLDELDRELVALLNERARVSRRVGQLKVTDGTPVFAPGREAQVIENVYRANQGPLSDRALRYIWTEILSSSIALQRPIRVGYLGPVATFSHEAARRRFGASAEHVPFQTIADVFNATTRREVEYGVVPVENSNSGGVPFTLDELIETELTICAEIELPVTQNLISHGTLETITRVYSHPMAILQCRDWLARNLPRAEVLEVSSTAKAVEIATEPHIAAIALELAAETYGVPVLVRRIEDQLNNMTRFLVIGEHGAAPTGRDKTGLIFGVRHRAGALQDALRLFASARMNLTRIESRPSKRQPWEYVFFVDFQGHREDSTVALVLEELRDQAQFLKVLGSWPEEARPSATIRV